MNAPKPNRYLPLFLLAILSTQALAQRKSEPDDVRDAFIYTRVKVSAGRNRPARANRRRQIKASTIGLGYTIFQRDINGAPVRVSPSQEFRKGDAVRLVVEANVDGYLYIFHTENDGRPEMIFPDARLNDGRNTIVAHAPYETPNRRWFNFDERAATERLYIVVTRTPLPGAPIGNGLLAFCEANKNACPWRPADAEWSRLVANASTVREEKAHEFGQTQTEVERDATERGLRLGSDDPTPSVIRMSKSPQAHQLVTMITLIHK
jgi:hypothetical protein